MRVVHLDYSWVEKWEFLRAAPSGNELVHELVALMEIWMAAHLVARSVVMWGAWMVEHWVDKMVAPLVD